MDAFDPLDVFELLDAMDWWEPRPLPAAPRGRNYTENAPGRASSAHAQDADK